MIPLSQKNKDYSFAIDYHSYYEGLIETFFGRYAWRTAVEETCKPIASFSKMVRDFLSSPANPFRNSLMTRYAAASLDICHRATRTYDKPSFDLGENVIEKNELELPFGTLKRFLVNGKSQGEPLLVVAPMSGHHATLLRDTVGALIEHHDVYLTDWMNARDIPLSKGVFGFDDYVTYLMTFLKHIGEKANVLAVCQSGPAAIAATAILSANNDPSKPKTLALMGAPIDTRISPTSVNDYAKNHSLEWLKNNVIDRVPYPYAGAGRRVYPGSTQLFCFIIMNYSNHLRKGADLFNHQIEGSLDKARKLGAFYDEYFAVMDMDGKFFLDTYERVFWKHDLPDGRLTHKGYKVDTKSIKDTALLTIEGKKDDICGLGQTKAAHTICPNIPQTRRNHMEAEVGHYGLFSGSKWRTQIQPVITQHIRQFG